MAASRPDSLPFVVLALILAVHVPALAILPGPDLPISLDADSSELDRKNNTVLFRNVEISQGDVGISADEATATGLDFEDSNWVFTGNVRIRVTSGSITADKATVEFAAHQLSSAIITGTPAAFEHRASPQAELARGRAGQIIYDVPGGTITLTEDAWLSEAGSEISGGTLVYRIAEERVIADAEEQGDNRVHITIDPSSVNSTDDEDDRQEP